MIAADTSAWVDFEIISGPALDEKVARAATALPKLEIYPSFWERAGQLRRSLLRKGLKAQSMDCLIAQNCIDHGVPLINFRRGFSKVLEVRT